MRIFLVTNSARGEAIADALKRSPQKPELIVATTVNSPGFQTYAKETHVVDIMNLPAMTDLAKKTECSFAFIAPEDPIGGGLVDCLEAVGIPAVAPKKNLGQIESSKRFARDLFKKYGIDGNPHFRVFTQTNGTEKEIRTYIEEDLRGQYVVKYDALKGGKGVKVSGEHLKSIDDGVRYALECIGECGTVVIEEKLIGVEFSLLSFVSGTSVVDMPAVQDHKRAFEGDTGSNTGGMGTYSDATHGLPFLDEKDLKAASDINRRVAEALQKECGEPYKGILYGGFIAVADGVRVIEYNARFGDPEALNVLPLLKTDFVAVCQAIIKGTLTPDLVKFSKKATVCKYITPKSYPDAKNEVGQKVTVPDSVPENVRIYYGDVQTADSGDVLLGGSRSIGIVGIGATLPEAETAAQVMCEKVSGPVRFRADIGTADTIRARVDLLRKLREKR